VAGHPSWPWTRRRDYSSGQAPWRGGPGRTGGKRRQTQSETGTAGGGTTLGLKLKEQHRDGQSTATTAPCSSIGLQRGKRGDPEEKPDPVSVAGEEAGARQSGWGSARLPLAMVTRARVLPFNNSAEDDYLA
jgi:hypothetical protein